MRPQFPPHPQLRQPQQSIGGHAVVSGRNLTSLSTDILQASVPTNSHAQYPNVDTSIIQYDSYNQQRLQVGLYNILIYSYSYSYCHMTQM